MHDRAETTGVVIYFESVCLFFVFFAFVFCMSISKREGGAIVWEFVFVSDFRFVFSKIVFYFVFSKIVSLTFERGSRHQLHSSSSPGAPVLTLFITQFFNILHTLNPNFSTFYIL